MSRRANRIKFVVIVSLFLVPLLFSFGAYKLLPEGYKPDNMSNNGTLLQPIYTLSGFNQLTVKGQSFSNKDVEKVWTLVHLIQGGCGEDCSKMLYKTRQLRISLGKNIHRIKRVAVLEDPELNSTMDKMWASHPDMKVLLGVEGGLGQQVGAHIKDIKNKPYSVFLVDPLGNLMMEFPAALDPKLIFKDMKKLLKLSHVG